MRQWKMIMWHARASIYLNEDGSYIYIYIYIYKDTNMSGHMYACKTWGVTDHANTMQIKCAEHMTRELTHTRGANRRQPTSTPTFMEFAESTQQRHMSHRSRIHAIINTSLSMRKCNMRWQDAFLANHVEK